MVSIGFGMVLAGMALAWSLPKLIRPPTRGVAQSQPPAPSAPSAPPWAEIAAGPSGASFGSTATLSQPEGKRSELPPSSQAWRVVLDPLTGQPLQEPPRSVPSLVGPSPSSSPPPQAGSSSQGLREIPGTTRAGGVKVDLGDRFFHFTTVTLDAQGHLTGQCQQRSAAPSAESLSSPKPFPP